VTFDNSVGTSNISQEAIVKKVLSLVTVGLMVMLAHAAAGAQSYPGKPVRMVIPFSAGGGTDLIGRLLAKEMSANLGQQVVVENRTGAGGRIGIEYVARADPDGYTALFVNQSIATNETAYSKLNYSAQRDFVPVSRISELHFILAVHPSLPVKSVKELTAYIRERPGKVTYASGGLGGVLFFAAELYKHLANIDVTHVPYRGGGEATNSVLGQETTFLYTAVPVGLTHIKAGRLRGLAISGAQRSALAPDIPTMAEAGVKGYDFSVWNMVLVPTGTPRSAVNLLHGSIAKALNDKGLLESYRKMGAIPAGSSSPGQAQAHLEAEIKRYGELIKAIGLKLD
jgi:tripartite-type tricarboxylate transporter receptor subunit TctC